MDRTKEIEIELDVVHAIVDKIIKKSEELVTSANEAVTALNFETADKYNFAAEVLCELATSIHRETDWKVREYLSEKYKG